MNKSYLQELSENYDGTDDAPVSYYNDDVELAPATSSSLTPYMSNPRVREAVALGRGADMEKQFKDNDAFAQSVKARQAIQGSKVPLENYIAGATNQSDYRNSMMQYLSAGGQKPKWYTGDFETDKPNIDTAVKATMTPLQQLQRQAQQENLQSLQESRQAQTDLRKQAQVDKVREAAAKREGVKTKASEVIPSKDERETALEVLDSVLGISEVNRLPPEQATEIARTIASRAKAKMNTPEGKGVDYETLIQDELQELMVKGQLKKGTPDKLFGLVSGEKPSYNRAEKPSDGTAEKPSFGKVPKPGEVHKGYKYKGGDPSKPTSWEKA